jgi:hypothetical protein
MSFVLGEGKSVENPPPCTLQMTGYVICRALFLTLFSYSLAHEPRVVGFLIVQ